MVVRGYSNEEVATSLGMTVRTVKYHISQILAAVSLHNRVELIAAHGRAINGGKNPPGLRDRLQTERQLAVYDLMVAGHAGPEIAKRLGITPRTVKFHSQSIQVLLGQPSQARLISTHWGMAAGRAMPRRRGRPPKVARLGNGVSSFAGAGMAVQQALADAFNERRRIEAALQHLERALVALEA
jgi:DNA-binding CsgD family transcriptional regulator